MAVHPGMFKLIQDQLYLRQHQLDNARAKAFVSGEAEELWSLANNLANECAYLRRLCAIALHDVLLAEGEPLMVGYAIAMRMRGAAHGGPVEPVEIV